MGEQPAIQNRTYSIITCTTFKINLYRLFTVKFPRNVVIEPSILIRWDMGTQYRHMN